MLLGSRIIAQRVTEDDLREKFRSLDDGRSFWEHAEAAGYDPSSWRECSHVLDDLTGWIEMHIEQARVLQDTGNRIGVVNAIAGYIHADVVVHGRGDHAGATPMDLRLDPTLPLAEAIVELERLARAAGQGTVGTVGEIEVEPGLINAIASRVRFSLDIRGAGRRGLSRRRARHRRVRRAGGRAARACGPSTSSARRSPPHRWTSGSSTRSRRQRAATGEPYVQMHSGAAHDTMCVADRVPTAMVFVPCRDGISHHPDELADPADAALAAEIILRAIDIAAVENAWPRSTASSPERSSERWPSPCGWDCGGAATSREALPSPPPWERSSRSRSQPRRAAARSTRAISCRSRSQAHSCPACRRSSWCSAIQHAGASRALIVIGTAPLLSVLLALLLLDEPFKLELAIGTVLVVAAGIVLARETRPEHFRLLGGVLALLCAVMFAGRDNIVRWASREAHPPPLVATATSLVCCGARW